MFDKRKIVEKFALSEHIVVYPGDCIDLLKTIPDESLKLVITSPPYNIGKEYERRLKLESYDWFLYPFLGTATSTVAAICHNRRGAGAMIN